MEWLAFAFSACILSRIDELLTSSFPFFGYKLECYLVA
jgi:hypothetical protein